MTKEEKIKIGEQMLTSFQRLCDAGTHDESSSYAAEILHAVNPNTHDTPIPREDMCIALADAAIQGKTAYVIADDNQDMIRDGWTYHIEIR